MTSYVNPFGGYAAGYGQGAQQENETQLAARRARQMDWQAQYMNPDLAAESHLRLGYNQAAEPWREKALPVAYNTALADEQGKRLGVDTGAAALFNNPTGMQTDFSQMYGGPSGTPNADLVSAAQRPQDIQALGIIGRTDYEKAMMGAGLMRAGADWQRAGAYAHSQEALHPAGGGFDPSWLGAPTAPDAPAVPSVHPVTAQALSGMPPEYAAHAIHLASQVSGHHPAAVHAAVVGALPTAPAPAATAPPAAASTNFTTDTGP